jgi:hypothetical protein
MSTKKKKKKRIEVGHLMTKVVLGFLREGVGKGEHASQADEISFAFGLLFLSRM